MLARQALERTTHRLVFKRRLPDDFGRVPFLVSPEGGLRYLRRSVADVDARLLDLVREWVKPGDVVWDVGANVGLFSFAAAGRSGPEGQVIAVEPDAWLVQLLRRSAGLAGSRSPVTVVPIAAAERTGLATFHVARRNRSTNYLDGYGTSESGGSRETQLVPTMSLDDLADEFPLPNVLKIDVEGAEHRVLRGASRVLAAQPVVICEVATENSDKVADRLRATGYELLDGGVPANERNPVSFASAQTLAVPRRSDPVLRTDQVADRDKG